MLVALLKERIELEIRFLWLKRINKEVDRYNKYNQKARILARTVHDLIRRYNELYPDDKISTNKEEL